MRSVCRSATTTIRTGRWIFGLAIRRCETSNQCGSIRKASAATAISRSAAERRRARQPGPTAPPEHRGGRQHHRPMQEHAIGPKPHDAKMVLEPPPSIRPSAKQRRRHSPSRRTKPTGPGIGAAARSRRRQRPASRCCTAKSRGHCTGVQGINGPVRQCNSGRRYSTRQSSGPKSSPGRRLKFFAAWRPFLTLAESPHCRLSSPAPLR